MEELIKKLRSKQGPALVINPPEGYILGIETDKAAAEKFDFIQLFVNNSEDVEKWLPEALPLLNEDALFWITYLSKAPK